MQSGESAFSSLPLPGPYGLCIEGASASSLEAAELRQIARLLFDNRVVVLKDQDTDMAAYVRFARQWGDPVYLIAKNNRREDFPEVIVQSNSEAVPVPIRNNSNHWHCDSSYESVAATVTMLLGIKAPAEGGETLFADLVSAFEDLPPSEQKRLEALQVHHGVSKAQAFADETIVRPSELPAELNRDTDLPDPVVQPLVRVHPISRRKALYGLGGSAYAIVGMDDADGDALIAELKRHATQSKFVQRYKLMPHDILIWDNFSVMHRATPIEYSDAPDKARLNYRISLKGLPSFLA